jgi:hypothetical protein
MSYYHWKPAKFLLSEADWFTYVEVFFRGDTPVWMGKEQMINCYRLHCGTLEQMICFGSFSITVDCGQQPSKFALIKEQLQYIIMQNPVDDPLRGIPTNSGRPYYEDAVFLATIKELYSAAILNTTKK